MGQLSLNIATPDQHATALHPRGIGMVTIARKEQGRWKQGHYRIDQLPEVVRMLGGEPDVFISQNRFYGSRLVSRLAQLDALFADLDYYRIAEYHRHTPEQIYGLALEYLDDAGIPRPTLAIGTGRGVALVWLHNPVPRQALPRWMACQKHIFQILSPLGADSKALDAARVLRLVGTTNNTVNRPVRALNRLTEAPWDFDTLADEVLPVTRAEIHSLSIERSLRRQLRTHRPPKQFNAATLWEGRLAELQALRKYRHERGQLPHGQRDAWLFLAGVAMSWLAPPTAMQRELYGLARQVAGWDDYESRSRMQAVIDRARKAGQGETVEWRGQRVDARYHFKDSTMVDWLAITTEEMEQLGFKHLAHDSIKQTRKREKDKTYRQQRRRQRGAKSRSDYEKHAEARRTQAVDLRERGLTWQQVAETMGISLGAAKMLGSRSRSQKVTGPSPCMVA